VGSDDTTVYENNTHGCRPGYTCFWSGGDGDPSGVCDVGNFTGMAGTVKKIGEDCADDSECYSPFGQGACAATALVGCTVFDCAAPGMPDDVCGEDAECVEATDGVSVFSLCVAKCSAAETCLRGAACFDLDGDRPSLDDTVCWPLCAEDSECRDEEVCDEIVDDLGECTPAP
jgi:hypothetical protein